MRYRLTSCIRHRTLRNCCMSLIWSCLAVDAIRTRIANAISFTWMSSSSCCLNGGSDVNNSRLWRNSFRILQSRTFLLAFVVVLDFMADNNVAARVREALDGATDETLNRMQLLDQERKALGAERKRITREIKNESQKRQRLLQKARNLSTDDLLQVAMTRSAAKAKAKAKAANVR